MIIRVTPVRTAHPTSAIAPLITRSWVGWMTPFSSTTAIGGWVKRHPPYEVAGPADKPRICGAEGRP